MDNRIIIFIILVVILVGGGIIYGLLSYSIEKNQELPKIEVAPSEYDAGTVSMAQGLVKHTYRIKNRGEGVLKINDIRTSCMCTTVVLKMDGKEESPQFGMHGAKISSLLWSWEIPPGKSSDLEVVFDPAYHAPRGTGKIVRIIYISSNDPENKKAEVKLLADVTP